MTNEQKAALRAIARSIVQTVAEVDFAPASSIHRALQDHGASVNQCDSILNSLVAHDFLVYDTDNHTYTATGKVL
jgi:hypothetical protein